MKKGFIITGKISKAARFSLVEKSPLERFKEMLLSFLTKKPEKPKPAEKEAKKTDWIAWGIYIIIGAFILSILYLSYQLITLASQLSSIGPAYVNISAALLHSWFSDFGSRVSPQSAQVLSGIIKSDHWPVHAEIYLLSHPFSNTIYVVKEIYPQEEQLYVAGAVAYLESLRKDFKIRWISIKDIPALPAGSIVLVAGKYPPAGFFSSLSKNPGFLYVFFVTLDPVYELSSDGRQFPVDYWKKVGIIFESADLIPKPPLRVSRGLYKVGKPYLDFASTVSLDNRVFVFLPIAPSLGWVKDEDLAHDLSILINQPNWIEASPVSLVTLSSERFIIPAIGEDPRYVLVRFYVNNVSASYLSSSGFRDYVGHVSTEKGSLLLPFSVSKTPMTLYAFVSSRYGRVTDEITLEVEDENGTLRDIRQLGQITMDTTQTIRYENLNLKAGGYILTLKGKNEVYGRYYFELGELNASGYIFGEKVILEFLVNGKPYRVERVKIRLRENPSFGEREYTYVNNVTIELGKLYGGSIPVGKYHFEAELPGKTLTVEVIKPPQTGFARLFGNPLNLAMLILAALIYFASYFVRPKEEKIFYIDIPDFASTDFVPVKLKVSEVMKVFDDVNKYYRWRFTPLDLDDIRFGLRMRWEQLKDLVIDDYSIMHIMEELKKKGLVHEVLDYYAPTSWEKKCGYSIKQMVLYRILRDKCIELAIPFSYLILNREKGYHVHIKVGPADFYVYLFDEKEDVFIIRNAPKLLEKGIVFVVFLNEDDLISFKQSLYSGSYAARAFRFLVENNEIQLLTIDEFIKHLEMLKG